MIANHVLEVSVNCKLESQCVRFKKTHCFALVVLNQFPICFIKPCSRFLLYYYAQLLCWKKRNDLWISKFERSCVLAKTKPFRPSEKEMIYESVNLKWVVNEPKQNSFGLQSITTRIGLQTLARSFIKNSFPQRGGGGSSILDHTGCTPIWGLLFQLKFLNQA